MSKITISFTFLAFLFLIPSLQAQGENSPFEPQANGQLMFTAGIGASGWGIPLFGRLELPVSENITIGGGASYQSTSERFFGGKWRHSIIGLTARGSYHFNTLINLPDTWDFYGGASVGYYIWNTRYSGDLGITGYNGTGAGGTSIGFHAGGRYFVNEKIAVNLEAGGGTVIGGGTIGATFML